MAQHLLVPEGGEGRVLRISTENIEESLEAIVGSFIYEGDIPVDALYLTWDSENEVVLFNTSEDKLDEQETQNRGIDEKNRLENSKDFFYDDELFVADQSSIQAVQNQCLLMDDADPIPTPAGMWVLSNGSLYAFTVGEFKLFATEFFMRGSNNFGIKTLHKNSIQDLVDDPAKTGADVTGYNYSEGWL